MLVVNKKYCILPSAVRIQFCTEITKALMGKSSYFPISQTSSMKTLERFTDLKFTSLVFLTSSSQNLQRLQQLSPKWMSSPGRFQIWVRLGTKAKIRSDCSQRPNLEQIEDKHSKSDWWGQDQEAWKNPTSPPHTAYSLAALRATETGNIRAPSRHTEAKYAF